MRLVLTLCVLAGAWSANASFLGEEKIKVISDLNLKSLKVVVKSYMNPLKCTISESYDEKKKQWVRTAEVSFRSERGTVSIYQPYTNTYSTPDFEPNEICREVRKVVDSADKDGRFPVNVKLKTEYVETKVIPKESVMRSYCQREVREFVILKFGDFEVNSHEKPLGGELATVPISQCHK